MRNRIVLLTPAELKILLLIGKGMKNDEIVEQLGRAKDTIRSHIKSLYAKLNTSNRLQLILYAIDFAMDQLTKNAKEFNDQQVFVNEGMRTEKIELSIAGKRGKHQKGYVYFILDRVNGGVKIGWAVNPGARLYLMQNMNLNKLELIFSVEGTLVDERKLHKRFKRYNIHNEWFKYSDEIKTYIYRSL